MASPQQNCHERVLEAGAWALARYSPPVTAIEVFHRDLVRGYDAWMRELRGLASVTRSRRTTQALEFLTELGPRGEQENLRTCVFGMLMRTCNSVAKVDPWLAAYRALTNPPIPINI